ncbi:metal-dependent transcriptional regulator [Acetobacterium paludosum]|uniref:Metal-dependent transcriptional regulator n=2 Tax=Acetobacterium TaxID=33951 RepID=A0A923I5X7_9FIRM|nr:MULTISPECIES: metal-dependent transcriptional regulator [Acetobacterium]MBC3798293.1 metal-dependent transcriptional regulator [Acetobacterium tundrae]MBC3889590.1 metal-dependent transcriptional regulator [Acetobacterium paludosum]
MEKKLTESIEDYIETIYLEDKKNGKGVRITDVASKLNVSKASANDAVRKLKTLGHVEQERYGQIFLTESGEKLAIKVYEKHRFIAEFLVKALDVSIENAQKDACGIEHIISDETFQKIKLFLKNTKNNED